MWRQRQRQRQRQRLANGTKNSALPLQPDELAGILHRTLLAVGVAIAKSPPAEAVLAEGEGGA